VGREWDGAGSVVPKLSDSSALALLRIATGALVFPHGVRKLLTGPVTAIGKSMVAHGFPAWFAYPITFGELCGALLAVGLFVRYSAAVVALTLGGIVIVVQAPLVRELGTGRGVALEYPLLLALTATLFVLAPPTKWSLGKRR
jgi:putative oxidoreductase